jgi:hypothetical protein
MFRRLPFLLLALLLASPCRAEEKPSVTFAIVLHDRTTIQGAILPDAIEFVMKSGTLKISPAELRRVELGRHVSPATAQRIARWIEALDGAEFQTRETAKTELIALGAAAYPVLQSRLPGAGLELTGRLKDALRQIEEEVPAELLALPANDFMVTADSTLTGKIGTEEIKARTSFGEVILKVGQIRSIQAIREAVFEASAEKCAITPDSWLETNFQVDADTGLLLTASGKVAMDTGEADSVPSEPEGRPFQGPNGQIGLLMGRIGPDGAIFPIGRQTAVRTGLQGGKLYLHINPGGGGPRVSGSYKVRVVTGSSAVVEKRLADRPSRTRAAVLNTEDGDGSVYMLLIALRQEIDGLRREIQLGRIADDVVRNRLKDAAVAKELDRFAR